jgi:hypothetical protein
MLVGKKTIITFIGIIVGDWYKESTHVKNERLYVCRCIETILNQLQFGVHFSSRKKIV